MNKTLTIASYIFVIALWTVLLKTMWGPKDAAHADASAHQVVPICYQVIISEFGDPRLYRDKVCSDSDLARIYGEQQLREQAWVKDHECDQQDADEPDVKRMRGHVAMGR